MWFCWLYKSSKKMSMGEFGASYKSSRDTTDETSMIESRRALKFLLHTEDYHTIGARHGLKEVTCRDFYS